MVERQNLSEQVFQAMGQYIVQGNYPPGTLLNEESLGKQYQVSRTVIREALKALSARNLVVSRPRVGITIQPRHVWHWLDTDILLWATQGTSLSQFFITLTEMRLLLQPGMAKLAAERATPAQREQLTTAMHQLTAAAQENTPQAWFAAETVFQQALENACHNEIAAHIMATMRPTLERSHEIIIEVLATYQAQADSSFVPPFQLGLARHQQVYEAILAGDGAAAQQAMVVLLEGFLAIVHFFKAAEAALK